MKNNIADNPSDELNSEYDESAELNSEYDESTENKTSEASSDNSDNEYARSEKSKAFDTHSTELLSEINNLNTNNVPIAPTADFRTEKDLLGECKIDNKDYFGINTARAIDNFPLPSGPVNLKLVREIVLIKKAAADANFRAGSFCRENHDETDNNHAKSKSIGEIKANAIILACEKILTGNYDSQFLTNSLQGGAGTSTNMNVNEVIANLAIEISGGIKGDYSLIHPLNDVNMSQSTNDVYPTALRIAAIRLVRELSDSLADLQQELQLKENEFSNTLRLGRTELMDALPMLVGQGFGAYSQAIARDRWRIYKAEERLRQINIGGTAIGTGLNAFPKFTYIITENLQNLTGLGLCRAESPMDTTQNADVFVEVSGLLKTCAVNLMKISNDLRLLSSGPGGGFGELILPQVQAGSTIMPGKVNPVIPEMVAQIAIFVIANDTAITTAASNGQLELNAFMPLIADRLLNSLELLNSAVMIFTEKCIKGINVNASKCMENLQKSSAMAAGLINHIGYDKASELAKEAIEKNSTLREIVLQKNILESILLEKIFNPYEITKPGIPGGS